MAFKYFETAHFFYAARCNVPEISLSLLGHYKNGAPNRILIVLALIWVSDFRDIAVVLLSLHSHKESLFVVISKSLTIRYYCFLSSDCRRTHRNLLCIFNIKSHCFWKGLEALSLF